MKTAILTAISGYTPQDIDPWLSSLKNTGYSGKIIVIVYDENVETADYLKSHDCHVLMGTPEQNMNIVTQRFKDYSEVLKSKLCEDVDLAIHTDCRDVIFQSDPDKHLREIIGDYQIVASGEGVTFRHEDWNGDGLQNQLGMSFYNELADTETVCAGVIAGRKEALIDLFREIYDLEPYSKNPATSFNSVGNDQFFYNVLLRKCYSDVTLFLGGDHSWAAQLGTLIAIPMQSPFWSTGLRSEYHSFERFRKGNYIDNMLVDMPVMIDGKVCTPEKHPYTIVHQYDRYEPWAETILGKAPSYTIVTALYDLGRSGWKGFERPFEMYKQWMTYTLSIDAPMVIYVDEQDVEFVKEHRAKYSSKTRIISKSFDDLVTNIKWGEKIRKVMSSEEFLKDQKVPTHPEICVPDYNILMHEKIQFVMTAIKKDYFGTDHYIWLDAGVAHINARKDVPNAVLPSPKKARALGGDKMHLIYIDEIRAEDLNLEKFYKGHNVRVIGTSWGGHKDAIKEFYTEYEKLMDESLEKNLMDQDQSFLSICAARRRDIVKMHKGTWQDAINLWK
jgi:protein YibB